MPRRRRRAPCAPASRGPAPPRRSSRPLRAPSRATRAACLVSRGWRGRCVAGGSCGAQGPATALLRRRRVLAAARPPRRRRRARGRGRRARRRRSAAGRRGRSVRLRHRLLRRASALAQLWLGCSRAKPRESSAATTFAAAPPRSEPGSGSRLPSAALAGGREDDRLGIGKLGHRFGSGLRGTGTIPAAIPSSRASPRSAASAEQRRCPKGTKLTRVIPRRQSRLAAHTSVDRRESQADKPIISLLSLGRLRCSLPRRKTFAVRRCRRIVGMLSSPTPGTASLRSCGGGRPERRMASI